MKKNILILVFLLMSSFAIASSEGSRVLVIGRNIEELATNPLQSSTPSETSGIGIIDRQWILIDLSIMNLDDDSSLSTIDDGKFDQIIFDWSVWYDFQNREKDLHHFYRMLKSGGNLYIPDRGLKCITYDHSITNATYSGRLPYYVSMPFSFIYDQKAKTDAFSLVEKQIDAEMEKIALQEIGFSSFQIVRDGEKPYPIASNKDSFKFFYVFTK
ncbi:MAG: hypothetical protein HQK53_15750 [Oligoflexia bacterium]|nr:hypothetical protein [Oligoflexia bacterium]